METLGVLASGIAHDFNNMLGGILAHSELTLAEVPADSPVGKGVNAHPAAFREVNGNSHQKVAADLEQIGRAIGHRGTALSLVGGLYNSCGILADTLIQDLFCAARDKCVAFVLHCGLPAKK